MSGSNYGYGNGTVTISCGCWIMILIFNMTIGAACFDYTLDKTLGRNVPWYLDMVGGAIVGTAAIPAAGICWIVEASGQKTPFWGTKDKDKVEDGTDSKTDGKTVRKP
jgi:type IV secretory pathway VirB6-like protein